MFGLQVLWNDRSGRYWVLTLLPKHPLGAQDLRVGIKGDAKN